MSAAAPPPAPRRASAAVGGLCEDRSLCDRCISRGLPGSMMPAIYNAPMNPQGPGYVAIPMRMVNETRIIPLDDRPHPGSTFHFYIGVPWTLRGQYAGRRATNFERTACAAPAIT